MKRGFNSLFSVFVIICASCIKSSKPVPTNTDVIYPGEEAINITVVVQVSMDVARSLNNLDPPTSESTELLRMIETLGFTLEPMHHNTDDTNLQKYFIVEVPDQANAQLVVDRLLESEAVEAAYLQPPYGLP